MIEKLKQKGFTFSKLYMLGVSAGAQYSLRFTLWKPEYCLASATHGNGGDIILPEKANSVNYFVSVGTKDANFRQKNVSEFYKKAKTLGMNVKYKTYPVGHGLFDGQIKDSLSFFKQVHDGQVKYN
jgi:predicted esterase